MPSVNSVTATLLVLATSLILHQIWIPNTECPAASGAPQSLAPVEAPNGSSTLSQARTPQAPTDYSRVFSWLQSHGGDLDHVSIGSSHDLRGLYISRGAAAGEAILRVPSGLCLTITTFSARQQAHHFVTLPNLQLQDLAPVVCAEVAPAAGTWQAASRSHWQALMVAAPLPDRSDAARPHLHLLLALPDGDLLLDPFAIWYEALVQGPRSLWWPYLLALPQDYPLPLNYSTSACMSLLAALPGLARLTSARKAELQAAFPRLALLLQLLPGGAAALRRHNRCEAWSSFLWAYGTAKTRTTTLSTAAALNIDSKASSSSSSQGLDDPAGASQAAAGKRLHLLPSALRHAARWGMERSDYVVARLGARVMEWRSTSSAASSTLQLEQLAVVGALVPVLDLANHGSGAEVTARLEGRSDYFALVATRDLEPGEQVVISYNYDDDLHPQCNSRWLLEYGFVFTAPNQPPSRHCHAFRLTQATALAAATAASAEDGQVDPALNLTAAAAALAQQQAPALRLLKAWGLPFEVWAELDGTGQVSSTLLEWLSVVAAAASHTARQSSPKDHQQQQPPLELQPEHQHQARHMMRLLLREQHSLLQQHVVDSRALGCGQAPGQQHRDQCCSDLLEVAAGALQAVDSSIRGLLQLEDPSI